MVGSQKPAGCVYLDHHSTTPVDPRVLEQMLPYFTDRFGNASSKNHPFGWSAMEAVERAREQVASLIGGRLRDVVFTSGATEANNLAIKGAAARATPSRRRIVTVATEHRSVLDSIAAVEAQGFASVRLGVDGRGCLDLDALRAAITDETLLVSVMAANNEIGVIHPVAEIARIAHERGALVHCDAVQAAGLLPIDVKILDVDLLTLSAHKMYGPKGAGALCVAKRSPPIDLAPVLHGGGHERGLRSGTLNVPAIVGFGQAAELCRIDSEESQRLSMLRDRLWEGLARQLDGIHLNGPEEHRLANNLNVRFEGIHGESLLKAVAGDLAVSSGASCATASAEPSHVLRAIGLSEEQARASLRFGLGRFTTGPHIDRALDVVGAAVRYLRSRR